MAWINDQNFFRRHRSGWRTADRAGTWQLYCGRSGGISGFFGKQPRLLGLCGWRTGKQIHLFGKIQIILISMEQQKHSIKIYQMVILSISHQNDLLSSKCNKFKNFFKDFLFHHRNQTISKFFQKIRIKINGKY